jgi:hypothetical protein
MLAFVFLVFASTTGLGPASATVLDSGVDTFQVELEVEAAAERVVVAHVIDPGGDQMTISMAEVEDGVYRGVFEHRPADLLVVFEDVAGGEQTQAASLSELGVVFETPAVTTAPTSPEPPDDSLGWLGLGLGAASLSLLAFWVLAGRSGDEEIESEPDEDG